MRERTSLPPAKVYDGAEGGERKTLSLCPPPAQNGT